MYLILKYIKNLTLIFLIIQRKYIYIYCVMVRLCKIQGTYCEYEKLNNVVAEYLSNGIEFNKNLILFCCINYYFKCIKRKALLSSQDSKIYNRLSFKDCWDKDLSFKFKLLFSVYKLSIKLGNLLLYLRYKLFPVH